MRLLTFESPAGVRLGALLANGVCDLTRSNEPALASMQALIEGGDTALALARDRVARDAARLRPADIRWLAPLPRPAQLRDCLGFEAHLRNAYAASARLAAQATPDPDAAMRAFVASGRADPPEVWYRQPIYYKANRFAVGGPHDDVDWPAYSAVMDFELEFACVIGKGGKNIRREDARRHIFGYTVFNDFSARDAQTAEMGGMLGPAKGKDFDGGNILGPVIVTADDLPDPYNLSMRARVNGETWCDGSSSTMHWRFEDMIDHISRDETLHPGEVIGSGTVGGGCGLELSRFLKHGDVVELEVEGIGELRNRVLRRDADGGTSR